LLCLSAAGNTDEGRHGNADDNDVGGDANDGMTRCVGDTECGRGDDTGRSGNDDNIGRPGDDRQVCGCGDGSSCEDGDDEDNDNATIEAATEGTPSEFIVRDSFVALIIRPGANCCHLLLSQTNPKAPPAGGSGVLA
jgi:hypothetical protein